MIQKVKREDRKDHQNRSQKSYLIEADIHNKGQISSEIVTNSRKQINFYQNKSTKFILSRNWLQKWKEFQRKKQNRGQYPKSWMIFNKLKNKKPNFNSKSKICRWKFLC